MSNLEDFVKIICSFCGGEVHYVVDEDCTPMSEFVCPVCQKKSILGHNKHSYYSKITGKEE